MMSRIRMSALLLGLLILLAGSGLKSDQITNAATVSPTHISGLSSKVLKTPNPENNASSSPTTSQQRSEIRSFTITSREEDEYKFVVEYTYWGERGKTGVSINAWPLLILNNEKRVSGILSGSGQIQIGKGSITGSILCPPKFSDYPPAESWKLQVCFSDENGKDFRCKTFNAITKWRTHSKVVNPSPSAQTKSSDNFDDFYARFRAVLNKRDRAALKELMSLRFNWAADGYISRDEAFKNIGEIIGWQKFWQSAQKAVARKAEPCRKDYAWPCSYHVWTKSPFPVELAFGHASDGKWKWVAIPGD